MLEPRTEAEIFEELRGLCGSVGYVHALAYLCFRDNIVKYADEMTPEDMREMFSFDRVIRLELSTLVGLMIGGPINYDLPDAGTIQRYLDQTCALLEELHHAMGRPMIAGFTPENLQNKSWDPFASGEALREPIFYAGESAYSFQYRDLSVAKYHKDNSWLQLHRGFAIETARDVIHAVGKFQNVRLAEVAQGLVLLPQQEWTLLPGFSFTSAEIADFASLPEAEVRAVLCAFSLAPSEHNDGFRSLQDFNVASGSPLLRKGDDTFILFGEYSLAQALYESPFYWMVADKAYAAEAMHHRGAFTEEFSKERLERVFGKAAVYRNVDIYASKSKRAGEIDVLVIFGDRAIVLQAKSKGLTLEARKGNDQRIRDDFKKSVQESYDQGYGCSRLLAARKGRFVDGEGRKVALPISLKEIYVICVVSEHYPALSFQVHHFLKHDTTAVIRAPFVMDVFTLDAMTEMLESPLHLLSYLDKRTSYSERVMAGHENTILSYHLKRNLWLEKNLDFVLLGDDISADLDVAMSVRRDGIPGQRTPDGLLTRIPNTRVGKLLGEIEFNPKPEILEFGLMLLTLSEDACLKISDGIDRIARLAQRDGKSHDLTIGLEDAGCGLVIHCNGDPLPMAAERLRAHCERRKYRHRVPKWFGICIRPKDGTLRLGINLDYEWTRSPQMDELTLRMQTEGTGYGARQRKIGRNDPCPCDSGVKYKRCHGK